MRMQSPAGEMEVHFQKMAVEGDMLVIDGQFGVWNARIYVTAEEAMEIVKMLLTWPVIRYVLTIPFRRRPKAE